MDSIQTKPVFTQTSTQSSSSSTLNTNDLFSRANERKEDLDKLKTNKEFMHLMNLLYRYCKPSDIAKLINYSSDGNLTFGSLQDCFSRDFGSGGREKALWILTEAFAFFKQSSVGSHFYLVGDEAKVLADICRFDCIEDEHKTEKKVSDLFQLLEIRSLKSDLGPVGEKHLASLTTLTMRDIDDLYT